MWLACQRMWQDQLRRLKQKISPENEGLLPPCWGLQVVLSVKFSLTSFCFSRAVGGVRKRQSGSSNTAADCNFSKGIKVHIFRDCSENSKVDLQTFLGWDVPLGQLGKLNRPPLGGIHWTSKPSWIQSLPNHWFISLFNVKDDNLPLSGCLLEGRASDWQDRWQYWWRWV